MAISSSLSTALTGLKAHQNAIDVTSNNISNSSNPDYVRERVTLTTLDPINTIPGDIGIGVKISSVYRITDTFLFNRLTATSANNSKLSTMEKHLQEISTYFPDVTDNGIYKDLENFFNAWQTFASNPNDGSVKVDLASKTNILSDSIKTLSGKMMDIEKDIDETIKTKVEEANVILKQIADLNKKIATHEANNINHANELRDKRDALEKRVKELLGVKVFKEGIKSIDAQGENTVDYSEDYQMSLGGYPLVNNNSFHQLEVTNKNGHYLITVKKEDNTYENITNSITTGEVGGLLAIRGNNFDKNNRPTDGSIGDVLSSLNALSQGLIRSVNSVYSYSAQTSVQTDPLYKPISISPGMENLSLSIISKNLKNDIRKGNITFNVYDNTGNNLKELIYKVDPSKSLKTTLDEINKLFKDNGVDSKAVIENGKITFKPTDTDGDGTISNYPLVKDDGSLLFKAFNEIEYLPINKINTTDLPIPLENGSFDIVAYDNDGKELARRTINVDMNSTDPKYSTIEGIIAQINTPNIDDNQDNNSQNDIDDYFKASIVGGKFILSPKKDNIYVGLDNDSVNIGGAFGINKFFDGKDAFTISLRQDLAENPSKIHAYKAPNEGNNEVANEVLQLQFKKIKFYKNGKAVEDTIFGFYRSSTSALANETENTKNNKEVSDTLLKNISDQYYALTGVNIDEELVNLERFQRGYQANAKVITTINQMLDALFGIKQ